MTTWTEIFPDVDGSPVRGERDEFVRLATSSSASSRTPRRSPASSTAFVTTARRAARWKATRPKAFARFVDEVGGELDEVPRIAGRASEIFGHHHSELTRLTEWAEEGADSALARARTAWRAREELTEQASRLSSQVRQLEGDVRDAEDTAAADPAGDTTRGRPARRSAGRARRAGSVASRTTSIDRTRVLDGIRGEWSEIRDEENALNRLTVDESGRHRPRRPREPRLLGPCRRRRRGVGRLRRHGRRHHHGTARRDPRRRCSTATGRSCCGSSRRCSTSCSWCSPWSPCSSRSARPLVIGIFLLSALALTVNAALYATQMAEPGDR